MGDQCIMFIMGPVYTQDNGLTWLGMDHNPSR